MALITAARINNLQSRIALVLGNGAGENGYGQTLLSSQVSNQGGIIDADDMNNIYADILKARVHQVGPGDISIAQVIEDQNIVGEEDSNFISDSGIVTNDADGAKKGIADYETLMTSVETDKAIVHASQAVSEAAIASVRTNVWNGLIYHQVDVTFTDEDHRRHFFNTGGEIRFAANVTSASTAKGLDWAALCSEIGTVKFTNQTTNATGDGAGSAIGNFDLTSSEQTIYQKTGSGTYSGIYAGNLYTVKAKELTTSRIQFKIEFNDVVQDFNPNFDNNVDGRLESTVTQYRANGDVGVNAPSYANTNSIT